MITVITGASGLIGSKLVSACSQPTVLSRQPDRVKNFPESVPAYAWNPNSEPAPLDAFSDCNVVFHLAGEPVAEGRWTAAKKRRIRDSRVLGTRNLVSTLSQLSHKPRVLVSASAVGYYGDQNNNTLTETCNPGSGYLSRVCVDWEQEALAAEQHGIRVVCLRIGIVLAPEGGALTRMLTPFKLGFGGRLGHGNQWMPWIHIDDVIGMAQHAANCDELRGPVNVVAPEPVTNAVFTQELGSALNRPAILPVPEAALKLAFGDMVEILMSSHRAIPVKAEQSGYKFQYRQLSLALRQLLNSNDI